MSKITLATTFNKSGYESYGRRMLESFIEHGPGDVQIVAYYEGFIPDVMSESIEYRDLIGCCPRLDIFKQKYSQFELARGIVRGADNSLRYDYNHDAIKFCHKVYCITHAMQNTDTRYAFWIDADTVAVKDIPEGFFQSLIEGFYTCYLGRENMHSECGLVGFDTEHAAHAGFMHAFEDLFNSGDVFLLPIWHDCLVYDQLRMAFEKNNLFVSNNLSQCDTLHPFVNSVLGEYLDHLKGPQRKKQGYSNKSDFKIISDAIAPKGLSTGRYSQIIKIISECKPKTIVEVGTWNGYRAMEMAREALKYSDSVKYYGFDLFGDATAETDEEEKNVKPHYTKDLVSKFLEEFKKQNPGFEYELTAGNTRETLPEMAVDFAFIDGGHSVDTIASDYARLKGSKIVLFDDYYIGGIDTNLYGCNKVVETIEHELLPVSDPVSGGGETKLVLVNNGL